MGRSDRYVMHHFNFGFAGRKVAGVEYIGYDEKSGHLKTHVFGNLGPDPLEYTWEIGEDPLTNWLVPWVLRAITRANSAKTETLLPVPGSGWAVDTRRP
jgi:hypothetical protein